MPDCVREWNRCCPECPKRFRYPAEVRIYQRSHTGEKPYACTQCEFRTAQRGNLRDHMLRHTQDGPPRPYQCEECSATFSKNYNLRVHRRQHETGPKRFQCARCPHTTNRLFDLRLHDAKKHIPQPSRPPWRIPFTTPRFSVLTYQFPSARHLYSE